MNMKNTTLLGVAWGVLQGSICPTVHVDLTRGTFVIRTLSSCTSVGGPDLATYPHRMDLEMKGLQAAVYLTAFPPLVEAPTANS